MDFTSRREERLWRGAVVCLVLIYSSLYIARPIAESLRERNLLRAAVGLAFLLAAIPLIGVVRRWKPGWRVCLGLVAAALLYAPVFLFIHLPEERLHYLEYGLFCGLVYAALRERRSNKPLPDDIGSFARLALAPWFLALVLTLVAGWLDEAIQGILPNRFYDLRDVAFNFSAGILYLGAWSLVDQSRQWEARMRTDSLDR
jgi:hypothetical protein